MDPFHFPLVANELLTHQIIPQMLPNQFSYGYPTPFPIPGQVLRPQLTQLDMRLQLFWASQLQEVQDTMDFKNHSLPLARIKKIMKADEEVKMIAAETPVLFSKACEMFILELTNRAVCQAEQNKRRTLLQNDIFLAIENQPMFDFLVDIVPMDGAAHVGSAAAAIPGAELNQSVPCFYDPSNYSSLMMNTSHPDMVTHGSSFTQQHQYGDTSENDGTPPPSLTP